MAWQFMLYINNQSGRELQLMSHQTDPDWGVWYRDYVDDRGPKSIINGETACALGIRAASGSATGYECHVAWRDPHVGAGSYGTITAAIDVPFSGSNSIEIDYEGSLYRTEWSAYETGFPASGHDFTLTITVLPMGVQVTPGAPALDPTAAEETNYERYMAQKVTDNERVEHWPTLESQVPVVIDFDPQQYIPQVYMYPPKAFMVGRTAPQVLDRSVWSAILDPVYLNAYAKDTFVKEYFSVVAYTMNCNPRDTESIPAGSAIKRVRSSEVSSTIKSTLSSRFSIKTVIETGGSVAGVDLAATLESEYALDTVLEESTERVDKEEIEVDIAAADHTRLYVPWVISDALMIYRRTKAGTVELVAVSEWAREQLFRVYRMDNASSKRSKAKAELA